MEKIKTHFQVKIPTTYSIVFRLPKGVQLTILALCIWHMQFMVWPRAKPKHYNHIFRLQTNYFANSNSKNLIAKFRADTFSMFVFATHIIF